MEHFCPFPPPMLISFSQSPQKIIMQHWIRGKGGQGGPRSHAPAEAKIWDLLSSVPTKCVYNCNRRHICWNTSVLSLPQCWFPSHRAPKKLSCNIESAGRGDRDDQGVTLQLKLKFETFRQVFQLNVSTIVEINCVILLYRAFPWFLRLFLSGRVLDKGHLLEGSV